MIRATTTAPRKLRSEKKRNSTIGTLTRSSIATKAARPTAAPASRATISVEPQPQALPSTRARISAVSEAVSTPTPA